MESTAHVHLVWLPVAVLLLSALAPPALAVASSSTVTELLHSVTNISSTNWAGFAVSSAKNTVTDVRSSWAVPAISGTCPLLTNQYSSFWVGIDGYSSTTVEQIGTDSDCSGGSPSYYAWYEYFPNPSRTITSLTISSGDKIYAEVNYTGGSFLLTLKDTTTGKSFSANRTLPGALRSSAEWIAEAPSGLTGVLPLADFGTVGFGHVNTGINHTCVATISGVTGPLTKFSSIHRITMVNVLGTSTKAQPSTLGPYGAGFTVKWVSTGP
ncbi:MAG: G1 family endopeptidase [Thermoplasmata archaeon]|nr:G1 family endopeptidase [Thermoplasmata archaeon]